MRAVPAPPPAFPGDLSYNMTNLIGSWIVGPLYGIKVMLIVASTQFALCTGHVITLLVELIRGFLNPPWTSSKETSDYIRNQDEPERKAQAALYLTNSLIGDAILIWRLWIIWGRNLWLTAPFVLLFIATAVAGITGFTNLGRLDLSQTVFLPSVINWLTASWCLSIATQFGATLLIGYRVWKSAQGTSKGIGASRLAIVWILVESGALFSVTTIFMLGFSRANMGGIFISALGQISALGPTLIIVRVGLRGSDSSSAFKPARGSLNNAYPGPPIFHNPRDVESRAGSHGNHTKVHVGKATEIHLHDFTGRDASSNEMGRSLKSQTYVSEYPVP
ncbi:hypothetical protein BC827DRAFT_1378836 [Russula dissimulans]|nr:hypothetical protein BC827DRAFT_1378836 [Russula dissimulans]